MYKKFLRPGYVIPGVAALVALLAVVVFGIMCLSTAEVVDEGELLPYVKGYSIYRLRVLDKYEFFVEPDYKPRSDALNAYVLVGIAFISLTFAVVIKVLSIGSARKAFRLFIWTFFGANYLAADEFLGIHETLGHNMQFLTTIVPIAERPDDAIILFYTIPAFLFVCFFYKTLLASKAAVSLFVAALVMFAIAAVADGFALPIEEFCEMTSSLCIVSGVLSLGVHHIRSRAPQNAVAA